MDLFSPRQAPFVEWIVSKGLLHEPFVFVDVGCQGGEHPRWRFLGDRLQLYAFDALVEVIEELKAAAPGASNRHYFAQALGNVDGSQVIGVPPNRFETSFYGVDSATMERREVPAVRLDTLFDQGVIGAIDFIKLDCEGHEAEVLKGAQTLMSNSELLGVETETNFNISNLHPVSHFHSIYEQIVRHKMLVFDLAHDRVPMPEFMKHVPDLPPTAAFGNSFGRIATCNVLLARNLRLEAAGPGSYGPQSRPMARLEPDKVIKLAIIFELYGLQDWAVDALALYADTVGARLDLDKAATLLTGATIEIAEANRKIAAGLGRLGEALGFYGSASLIVRELGLRLAHHDRDAMDVFVRLLNGKFRS